MMLVNLSKFLRQFVYIILWSSLISIIINFNRFYFKIENNSNETILISHQRTDIFHREMNNFYEKHNLSSELINISNDEINLSSCFDWETNNEKDIKITNCSNNKQIISTIWTHDGSGIMKYIQWIITRKLENIKITRLNNNCKIFQENYFSSNLINNKFIQIYILSLQSNFNKTSNCLTDLIRIIKLNIQINNQIYFKRKSIKAIIAYQQLDTINQTHYLNFNWNISLNNNIIQKANFITEFLKNYFSTISKTKSIIINSEEMIYSNLNDCKKCLINFLSLLQIDIRRELFKNIIEYDSYQFTEDGTWWDQSETIERIISGSLPIISSDFLYSNDFYNFHGNNTFSKYVFDNRQCFRDGIFSQMQHETITNRSSTDQPERCSKKQFDCSFSDIYSFNDREQLYQSYLSNNYFNKNPIKCGFAIPTILDKIRNRYKYNHTCKTIVLTSISNCYDPLPTIVNKLPPNICCIALLDSKTFKAFQQYYPQGLAMNAKVRWDFIDLGESDSLFRVPAKITESLKMLGHRMFPLAKWIVWLDGKAYIININRILLLARTPIIGLHHSDFNRTSKSEVNLTNNRVILGEIEHALQFNITEKQAKNSTRLKISLEEIALQEAEYTRDGFYTRSSQIGLSLFDIAIFIYRNNQPCVYRNLCGWHNEVNYFSYRGQLSVYYAAERLHLYNYLGFIQRQFYHTMGHTTMC